MDFPRPRRGESMKKNRIRGSQRVKKKGQISNIRDNRDTYTMPRYRLGMVLNRDDQEPSVGAVKCPLMNHIWYDLIYLIPFMDTFWY